jgi:hypothetical protein
MTLTVKPGAEWSAVRDRAMWVQRLGPAPMDEHAGQAWVEAVATVAAYRDMYGVAGPAPFGADANSHRQHRDGDAAQAAISRTAFVQAGSDMGDALDGGTQEVLL